VNLVATLATGCGGDTGGAPATGDLPSGFKRIGGTVNGVLVAVPESWTTVDLAVEDTAKAVERLGLTGPALEQAKTGLRALAASKAVYALDPESTAQSRNRFPTNLNGFCQPSVGATAKMLIDAATSQLATIKAKVSDATEVPLGATRAVRIKYTLPAGTMEVKGTQYYVPSDKGKTCIVTLSTDLDGKDALFDQIGGTIRAV
jgi:hypothetical protein